MAGENLSAGYEDCAVYLPSLQQGYAAFPLRDENTVREGVLPAGLQLRDLNFLDTRSKLWHCKYTLYSAGQFEQAQIRTPDIVSTRAADTVVVGDSGGYQIATGKLKELKGWSKQANNPNALAHRWLNQVSIRDRLLRWLDRYSDYAMTLDMPLWILKQQSSPFRNLTAQQLIDLSYENLKYFADNRGKATGSKAKYLNVLQDAGDGTGEAWYAKIRDFDFEGWAFGGDTKKDWESLLWWVRRLLDDGKLNSKTEWLHVLMMSPPVNAVLLTALQRRLRELLGNKIQVSYDSSTPFQVAGISQKIAVPPKLTSDIRTWTIGSRPYPQDPAYWAQDVLKYLTDVRSPVTELVSINDFHWKRDPMETRFFDTLAQHLLTNHNLYVYHSSALHANQYARIEEQALPTQLSSALKAVEGLGRNT